MNAFRNTLQRSALNAGRRFAHSVPKQPIPEIYQNYSFRKAFGSDPSTYPLIVIMSCAVCFVTGMSANALMHYKDLRISPSKKHETIQTWGKEHRRSVTSQIASRPIGFHADGFKSIQHEGLGVDHEEWKKTKAL